MNNEKKKKRGEGMPEKFVFFSFTTNFWLN